MLAPSLSLGGDTGGDLPGLPDLSGLPDRPDLLDCVAYEQVQTGALAHLGVAAWPEAGGVVVPAGLHTYCLRSLDGADLALSLFKWDPRRGAWRRVASADEGARHETINHAGGAGTYGLLITSAGGAGGYVLGAMVPGG